MNVTLNLADAIIDCPTRGTSMNLPIAALSRLDAMGQAARSLRAGRNELLAALIASAPLDPEHLEKLVTDYRHLRIGDVVPGPKADDGNVVVQMRKPGRPAG